MNHVGRPPIVPDGVVISASVDPRTAKRIDDIAGLNRLHRSHVVRELLQFALMHATEQDLMLRMKETKK